jgi:uncharacterized protein (TIGR02246 family)
MKALTLFTLLLCVSLTPLVHGQEPVSDEATHNELRALRDALLAAFDKVDIEAMLKLVHPNVVFTAMNAEVCRGPEQIRAYLNRMMTGPNRVVERVKFNVTVDTLSILYGGDTGVAYGSSLDHYTLTDGSDFEVKTRWSATVVKENNRWLLASVQSSANLFDNPLLTYVQRLVYWGSGGAGAIGLLVGLLVGRIFKRNRA